MGFLSKLFGGGIGVIAEKIGRVADELHLSGEEKQEFQLKMEALVLERDRMIEESFQEEMKAKSKILVAELTQGDKYTKRARPTVVYGGLLFIFINYVLVPIISRIAGINYDPLKLPEEFWYGWSGIVATWSVGRSLEKTGARNKIVQGITGNNLDRAEG